jgi:hypothetical protein
MKTWGLRRDTSHAPHCHPLAPRRTLNCLVVLAVHCLVVVMCCLVVMVVCISLKIK